MKILDIIKKEVNHDICIYDNSSYLKEWGGWYSGKVKDFHEYQYYNGQRLITYTRMTLGMAKKVCEDWANLLINEKTDIVLSDEASQNKLWKILEDCDFWQKANDGVEKTFALGGGVFAVSVENLPVNSEGNILPEGRVNVTFCNAKKVIPIKVEDGKITECALIRIDTDKAYVCIHYKDEDGTYKIRNFTASGKADEDNFTVDEGSEYVFDTKSKDPWFFYLRPNIANNIDIDSPLGISVFANAIDTLKEVDLVYDSYANEFILGRKRIFVKEKSATIDMGGEIRETFDSRDGAFYVLPESDDGSPFILSDTQTLRIGDHKIGLQDQLNVLSSKCGMGTEHYKFDAGSIATATQIISENSDMFRSIKRHEIFIEKALKTIVKAVIYASNTFTSQHIDYDGEIEVKFDDSIIEDKKSEREQDRLDVAMKVMSKAEYRSKHYNEDIDSAQKKIDEIEEFSIPEIPTQGNEGHEGGGNE